MPRAMNAITREPYDYCQQCYLKIKPVVMSDMEYDVDHPDYEEAGYKCGSCGKQLTSLDNWEDELAIWQSNNCSRCRFADSEKVGTGEPCCTRLGGPEPKGAICLARRN